MNSVLLDVASDDKPTLGAIPDFEPGGQTPSKKCNGYVPTDIISSIWINYIYLSYDLLVSKLHEKDKIKQIV